MAEEQIIIEVVVDNAAAERNIRKQTEAVQDLTNANKVFQTQNKELNKDYKTNTTQITENNSAIAKNKAAIQSANASRKSSIKDLNTEKNSLNALRNKLADTTKQRNELNTTTKRGKAQFEALNKSIKSQSDKLKIAEQAGGDFRRSVGDYGKATVGVAKSIDGMTKAIDKLSVKSKALDVTTKKGKEEFKQINVQINNYKKTITNASQTNQSFTQSMSAAAESSGSFGKSLVTTFKAILTNPIGILITAISGLIAIFAKSQSGIEFFRKAGAALDATFGLLVDSVESLGISIIDAFTNPKKALDDIVTTIADGIGYYFTEFIPNAIQKVVDGFGLLGKAASLVFDGEFSKAADVGAEAMLKLGDGITDIIPFTALFKTVVEASAEVVKELAAEIEVATSAAFGLESAMIANEKAIADQQVVVAKSIKSQKELNLLIEDQTASIADRIAAGEKFASVEQAQITESIRLQEERIRLLKAQNDITNSTEEDIQRVRDAEIELANLQAASLERQVTNQNKLNTVKAQGAAIDAKKKQQDADDQAFFDKNDEIRAEKKKQKGIDDDKEKLDIKAATGEAEVGIAESVAGAVASFAEEGTIAAKLAGIAQVGISTARGIIGAFAGDPLTPFPVKAVQAGVVGSIGALQAAKIAGIFEEGGVASFADGGMVDYSRGGIAKGPSHKNGGIQIYNKGGVHGGEMQGKEAIINTRSTAKHKSLLSAINVDGGGKSFADGGINLASSATSGIDGAINAENSISSSIAKQSAPQVAVTDINRTQSNVSVKQNRAKI